MAGAYSTTREDVDPFGNDYQLPSNFWDVALGGTPGATAPNVTNTSQLFPAAAPPAPAPSSGGGSSGGGGWGAGDFASMITGDSLYGQQQADLSAESAADAAARAQAIQKYLIMWGAVPDLAASAAKLGIDPRALNFLNSDVTDLTRSLADKNTKEGLSVLARLQKENKDRIRAIKNSLAARGMAKSGEAGYLLGEEGQRYKQSLTDNEQQLAEYIMGAIQAFTTGERDRKRTLSQYLMSAADRQLGFLGDASMGGGSGGGSGHFQYSGGAQDYLSSHGFNLGQVESDVSNYMSQRGWGPYRGPGGTEAPQIMENGQLFQADGVTLWNGQGTPYVRVKVGTPGGNSTETIPVSPPSSSQPTSQPASQPTSQPAPQSTPQPTYTPPPATSGGGRQFRAV